MNGHDPEHQDPAFASTRDRARQLFERSVAGLDVGTGNNLRLRRRAALAGAQARQRQLRLPAAAGVAALLLGLAWWLPTSLPTTPLANSTTAADNASLALESDDDAELYAWLGDAPVAVETGAGDAP